MSSAWSWLVVTLVVIFALGVGAFAVWFVAWLVAWLVGHLTTQPRPDRSSTDVETNHVGLNEASQRRRYRSHESHLQDPGDFDCPSRVWVHPYNQRMRDDPIVHYHPDLYRPPSPARSSPRTVNIGTTFIRPPLLPLWNVKQTKWPTSSFADYVRSSVSLSSHPSTSRPTLKPGASRDSLALESPISHDPLRMDTDSPSRQTSEMISFNLSRRDSWPLQSSLPRAQTVAYRNCSPGDTRTSVRWPFLGRVRNDLFSANSLLSSESSDNTLSDGWSDKERPKTAFELKPNPFGICRYVAKPGPRAPLPCDWYDGQEVQASSMRLNHSPAKPSEFSSPMRD